MGKLLSQTDSTSLAGNSHDLLLKEEKKKISNL